MPWVVVCTYCSFHQFPLSLMAMISKLKPRIQFYGNGSTGGAAWMMFRVIFGLIAAALLWNAATPALAARGDIPDIRDNLFGTKTDWCGAPRIPCSAWKSTGVPSMARSQRR